TLGMERPARCIEDLLFPCSQTHSQQTTDCGYPRSLPTAFRFLLTAFRLLLTAFCRSGGGGEHDDIHPPVLGSALDGRVARHRVILRVPGGGEAGGGEIVMGNEQPDHLGSSGGRKFPVGS